ncbi:hypothetical protein BX667DRAFT_517690 [Coemansia mojavensis]|nr:hypothetical protein BX667DRAFT_517690 [Coemansia mojavensis]
MNFGNFISQAKNAYEQYQESAGKHDEGREQQQQQQQQQQHYGGGPAPSNYQSHEQPHSSSQGLDFGSVSQLASGMFGSKSEHDKGGFDFGQIASMASGFLGKNSEASHGSNELISSALKMATSSGFNQGHQASHDDMKSSYLDIFSGGGSSGGLASQGQSAMGLAAAYMAFQKFQSGGSSSGGGGGQNQLVSMAIAEAKKLFGQHSKEGGNADEKATLATAAQAAMKLLR